MILRSWFWHDLIFFGKITVTKSLALPILIQILIVLPNPPVNILKDIYTTFYKFLWNGKRDKVKREILTNSYEDGGLKMIDIKLFCQALKMTWIKKYIDPLNFSPLKILLIDSLEKWGGDNILLLGKEGLNTVASTLNPFWKDILDNFSNLHNDKVIDGNDVLSQSIWLNSHQSQQK